MSGDFGGGSNWLAVFNCHLMLGAATSPLAVLGRSGGGAFPKAEAAGKAEPATSRSEADDCSSSRDGRSTAESVQFHSAERSCSQGDELTLWIRSGSGLYQYHVLYPPAARIRKPSITGRLVGSATGAVFFLLMMDLDANRFNSASMQRNNTFPRSSSA